MANKYSKSNQSSSARDEKIMREYEERRKRLNIGGKIMAIIIMISMYVTKKIDTTGVSERSNA